jgi:hypothetical protein
MGYARQCWFGYKYKNCRMRVPRGFSYLKKSKKVLHFRKINSVTSEKHEKKYNGVKYREKASQDTDNIIPKFFSTDGSLTLTIYLRQTCVYLTTYFSYSSVQQRKGLFEKKTPKTLKKDYSPIIICECKKKN